MTCNAKVNKIYLLNNIDEPFNKILIRDEKHIEFIDSFIKKLCTKVSNAEKIYGFAPEIQIIEDNILKSYSIYFDKVFYAKIDSNNNLIEQACYELQKTDYLDFEKYISKIHQVSLE